MPGFSPEHLRVNPDSVTECVVMAIVASRPLNLQVLICKVGTIQPLHKAVARSDIGYKRKNI